MLQTVFCKQGLGGALLLAVLAVVLTAASASHAGVEMISLRYRNAAEVLPLAKSMLGIARFTVAEWENKIVACLITLQGGGTVS